MQTLLNQPAYQAYSYAYPHKSAYGPLEPARLLRDVWAEENRRALFLYIHIPFCEMRCGFCNLFTLARPANDLYPQYINALKRQAEQIVECLEQYSFARFAIGGGTPTFLDLSSLEAVLNIAQKTLGADNIPTSVEVSPETATVEKLSLLAERGVDRISMGIQSFIEAETKAIHRRQHVKTVNQSLDRIRQSGFASLNLDLIYGIEGQTVETWLYSLREVLRFQPEEIYLYPLYVRPLTGLDLKKGPEQPDKRMQLYQIGREFLLENGYTQISMRLFRAAHAPSKNGPIYCCQEDGMVGIGSGARSYTRALHYSTEYAVSRSSVKDIILDYCQRPAKSFSVADYGIVLDDNDQKRRYLIKSILHIDGLNLQAYRQHFASDALTDFPEIAELLGLGLCECDQQNLTPTSKGLAYSDLIGPWLVSQRVQQRMDKFVLQ